ncbi:hypothetical protein FRC00_003197 [Tulasnella sp. 408]|nr:hypothetical protein FRC00_003197 [Tulasnella sp. 408]
MKHYGTPEEVSAALERQLSKWHLFFDFDTTHAHVDDADCVCQRMNNYALRLAFYWRDIGILLEKYEASEMHSQANSESRYLESCWEILEEMETEGQRVRQSGFRA